MGLDEKSLKNTELKYIKNIKNNKFLKFMLSLLLLIQFKGNDNYTKQRQNSQRKKGEKRENFIDSDKIS